LRARRTPGELDPVNISPTLRPLLRDILGADAEGVSDEMIQMVAKVVAEAKYLSVVLGDADESTAFQFCCYELN
jgi:hypothetical protein